MTVRTNRTRRLVVLLAAAALLTTGCGGDSETTGTDAPTPGAGTGEGSIAADFDFAGAEFTVGSKEFTEQKILGQITIAALEAAGAEVSEQIGLKGSTIVRKALTSGEIDMYWEYAGTGWALYLEKEKPVQGAMEQFEATAAADLAANGIKWLGPTGFGDRYAVARRSDAPGALGKVMTMSAMAAFVEANPDEASFCGAAEFFNRRFDEMQQVYDFEFPADGVHQNKLALNYVNVAEGEPCNFAEVFTTDARIQTKNLVVLADDKGVFLTQLAGLTMPAETFEEYPQLAAFAQALGEKLTQEQMIALNKMVDVEGSSPAEAAEFFLVEHGFIAG